MAHRKPKRKPSKIQKIQLCKRVFVKNSLGKTTTETEPAKDELGNIIKINRYKFIRHNY